MNEDTILYSDYFLPVNTEPATKITIIGPESSFNIFEKFCKSQKA